jgi:hypothetical protein
MPEDPSEEAMLWFMSLEHISRSDLRDLVDRSTMNDVQQISDHVIEPYLIDFVSALHRQKEMDKHDVVVEFSIRTLVDERDSLRILLSAQLRLFYKRRLIEAYVVFSRVFPHRPPEGKHEISWSKEGF